MFQRHVELVISPDRLRLTNSASGQTVERKALTPFSSPYRLIARQEVAMRLLKEIVMEMEGFRRWFIRVSADVRIEGSSELVADRGDIERFLNDAGFVNARII